MINEISQLTFWQWFLPIISVPLATLLVKFLDIHSRRRQFDTISWEKLTSNQREFLETMMRQVNTLHRRVEDLSKENEICRQKQDDLQNEVDKLKSQLRLLQDAQ